MGYLGRRIGLSQDNGDSNPATPSGAVGGGILDLFANGYFQRQGNLYNAPGAVPSGLTATGGIISDYTSGSDVYRAHIFTSSGTFDVTASGSLGDTVEYLVVAGGGGGGGGVYGGGGGAGGLRTNLTGHPLSTNNPSIAVSTSPGSYTVTVGGGGNGGYGADYDGINGTNSVFSTITSHGGGGGRGRTNNGPGLPGGSGGGQSYGPGPQGYGYNPLTPGPVATAAGVSTTFTQGQDGGFAPDSAWYGTGGGGAGQQGSGQNDEPWPAYGYPGGDGVQVYIAGPPTNTGVGQTSSWFAGGGGGGGPHANAVLSLGGAGGGGVGGSPVTDARAGSGLYSTGGGGGGGQPQSPVGAGSDDGGNGGSGIVVVRYKIAELTVTAKATGGAISFYDDKTIHAFTSSGTFTAPGTFNETVEYVIIAGGGSGGSGANNTNNGGGGGGAGGYRTGTVAVTGPNPYAVTVGAGGGGNNNDNNGSKGSSSLINFPSSITSYGGGTGYVNPQTFIDGASTGGTSGGSSTASGDPFPGTIGATPTSGWGHEGNHAPSVPEYNTGGGGGAGGAAPSQPQANFSPGGVGIQLPATFRDPASTIGAPGPTSPSVTGADTSGKYYVAGGGGGAAGHPQPATPKGGDGGAGGGGDGGGIDPNGNSFTGNGFNAIENTGSGGGGGPTGDNTYSGSGGSGLVLIAYPT